MVTVVVGLQWGDEGKGRAVAEYVAPGVDFVVRANGGANAGHTIQYQGGRHKFHQVPIGAFFGVDCVLGPGMVLDPEALAGEINFWEGQGSPSEIFVSDRAHVVLARHKGEDARREAEREAPLGTTLQGNGPAYADKMLRIGMRMREYIACPPSGQEQAAESLARHVTDTTELLLDAVGDGEELIVEGAHGVGLDIDHGDYPYVSSSSCTTAGLLASLGLPPHCANRVVGVFKPYSTRVGAGPLAEEGFPESLSSWLREEGREYGTTTGRPRRIGALDIRQVQRHARICGVTDLFMTKGDLLARAFSLGFALPVVDVNGVLQMVELEDIGSMGEDLVFWVGEGTRGYVSYGPEAGQGAYVEPSR